MANIIIHGSPYVKGSSSNWQLDKDRLHKRRRELSERIKDGIMSKSEMNRGEEGEPEFDARVQKYDRWQRTKDKEIREWQSINKKFKENKEEGQEHSLDDLRKEGKLKFD